MKKYNQIKQLAFFVVLVLIVNRMTGCGQKSKITEVLSDFEKACVELNADAILDTIEPNKANCIRLASGIVGALSGTDSSEILNAIVKFLSCNTDFFAQDI